MEMGVSAGRVWAASVTPTKDGWGGGAVKKKVQVTLECYLQDLQNARPQLREVWIWRQQHQVLQQRLSHHVHRDAQALVHSCSTHTHGDMVSGVSVC